MRLKTPVVQIGTIKIGGTNPVRIQSMTNTDTADVKATVSQIIELAEAGSELVRITVNDEKAAEAVPKIRAILNKKGYGNIPLIGDFHFNGHRLLGEYPACALALDKYRINPGNVGHDKNFETIIGIAKKYHKPVRIGANAGSVDEITTTLIKAVVESALQSAIRAEKLGLSHNKIILSVKMSDARETIEAYRLLARRMKKTKHVYALHLGLTEAGSGREGIVHSTAALSILLNEGIGDTIRVSLTPDKNSRAEEVKVCKDVLQSLGLRQFGVRIISCPGCGRADNNMLQKIVAEVRAHIEKNAKKYSKNPAFANLKIAIMGCVVNGPGEAAESDIALMLYGKNKLAHKTQHFTCESHPPARPLANRHGRQTNLHVQPHKALVYINGKPVKTLFSKNIVKEFLKILNDKIKL